VRLSEINTELSVCRVVGSATGKQQIADFSVYGNSANTHILFYGNGNDNSANWINTSGSEKLILGDGNNPDTMAVTGGNVGIGITSPGAKLDVNGNIKCGDGLWNGGHFIMGNYHLWIDTSGRLRIKNGAPTSATDGTVVGTQS